jgi:HAD superfamily hydrolase (TIGR01490 family)
MNENKPNIYFFDFDGTIISKDSFLHIIFHTFGWLSFSLGFLKYSIPIILMKLGCYDNEKLKQKIFSHFFKNMEIERFTNLCASYYENHLHKIIRPKFISYLNTLKKKEPNAKLVVVSASIENWILPFAKNYEFDLIATKIVVKDHKITGFFDTPNCHGKEKVIRIDQKYKLTDYNNSFAFGDSNGDKEMLKFVDYDYFNHFK